MLPDILASVLVADDIKFDKKVKRHSINNVLNSMKIDLFPVVLDINVYIKIWFFNERESVMLQTFLIDDRNIVRFFIEEKVVNKRSIDMYRGIDLGFKIKAIIPKPGNYFIDLCEEGKILYRYPLYIENIGPKPKSERDD